MIPKHRFRVKTSTTWNANSLQTRQTTDVPAKKVLFPMVVAGAREVRTVVFEHIKVLTLVVISYEIYETCQEKNFVCHMAV